MPGNNGPTLQKTSQTALGPISWLGSKIFMQEQTHIQKLVARFLLQIFGIEGLEIDFLDGRTGAVQCSYPFRISSGLTITINELNRCSMQRRMIEEPEPHLIVRQPQELLKKDVRDWLETQTGVKVDLSKFGSSLLQKIKSYKSNYRPMTRKRRMEKAVTESKRLQKQEKAFQDLKSHYSDKFKSI